ncbi:MAG: hypothetical protein ACRC1K_26120, partial [Planctomycetia bacterium]
DVLDRQLKLKPLDDVPEVPRYGGEPRVTVRKLPDRKLEVQLTVFRKEEIQTKAFEEMLAKAVQTFSAATDGGDEAAPARMSDGVAAAMPWVIDGERWHVGAKGFPPGAKPAWDRDLVKLVTAQLEKASPNGAWEWNQREAVWRKIGSGAFPWASLRTKEPESLKLILFQPKGQDVPSGLNGPPLDAVVDRSHAGCDTFVLHFREAGDAAAKGLFEFLSRTAKKFAVEPVE